MRSMLNLFNSNRLLIFNTLRFLGQINCHTCLQQARTLLRDSGNGLRCQKVDLWMIFYQEKPQAIS